MDHLNRDALRQLAQTQDDPCVSLFMPTYHVEAELSQNAIRLKNLLREARHQLKEEGFRDDDIDDILLPAHILLERADAWSESSEGLAVFMTRSSAYIYRVPLAFEEFVVTGHRFHLKPLFPLLASNNRFYVLALSKNKVRLFQGSHHTLKAVQVKDIPERLVDEFFAEKTGQLPHQHSGHRVGGRHDASFHGQGAQHDRQQARLSETLKRAFREIDKALHAVLRDEEAPLLVAGIERYLPVYREVNTYGYLIEDEMVAGSPDHLLLHELHERAWEVVEPLFKKAQEASLSQYRRHAGSDGLASSDVKEIIPAAVCSRIDTLFVPIGEHLWGHYDANSNAVAIHDEHQAGDDDLFDFAAVQTYLHGGTVHALQPDNMPSNTGLAATFRYPAHVEAVEE